jgi:hypothetical protein
MSRLARAIEILEAISAHFECDQELSPYAQILEGDTSIKEAIADCLGPESPLRPIPRSQRRRYVATPYGISGWTGKRKVVASFPDVESAVKWVEERD